MGPVDHQCYCRSTSLIQPRTAVWDSLRPSLVCLSKTLKMRRRRSISGKSGRRRRRLQTHSGFHSSASLIAFPFALSIAAIVAESKSERAGLRLRFAVLRLNGAWSWMHANANRYSFCRLLAPEVADAGETRSVKGLWPSPFAGEGLLMPYLPNADVTNSVSRYSVTSCTLPLTMRKTWQYVLLYDFPALVVALP